MSTESKLIYFIIAIFVLVLCTQINDQNEELQNQSNASISQAEVEQTTATCEPDETDTSTTTEVTEQQCADPTIIQYTIDLNSIPKHSKNSIIAEIIRAADTWNKLCDLNFTYVPNVDSDSEIGVISITPEMENTDAVGEAELGSDTGPYYGFEMKIHPKYINRTYAIAMHEFGHVIGLDHSSDKKSIMYKDLNKHNDQSKQDIAQCKQLVANWLAE